MLATQRQRLGGLLFNASPGKQFARPYLEKKITKRAGGMAQGEDPEFKSQCDKK
jgi:hypothetical protein